MKIYKVMQANLTNRGVGGFVEIGSFEKFSDAIKCVNRNYKNLKKVIKHRDGFLETKIEKFVNGEYIETKYSIKYVY